MANGDNPTCSRCGQPVDVVIDPKTGHGEPGQCTNPDCPSNTYSLPLN